MWIRTYYCSGGSTKFFSITFYHDNLQNYFRTNFALMHHHKYSLEVLENMIPWEREIYLIQLEQYIKEVNEKLERAKQNRS